MNYYRGNETSSNEPLNPPSSPKIDASRLRVKSPSSPTVPATGPAKGGKGGEEGDEGLPPLPPSNAEFVESVIRDVGDGASAAICSKPGDPTSGGWNAEAAANVDVQCPSDRNNYLNCSTFLTPPSGSFQARKEGFYAFQFFVLDDVGTKVDRDKLAGFKPT